MKEELPPPLVPADVDLRDFAFMPIDITRLLGSEFNTLANDAEWRAGVTLWMQNWQQVPAASLPDDDAALARLAELGRDLKTWKKIGTVALRGWIRCSDGRLHHRVVAEKALGGWLEKLNQRKSSAAGNAKRYDQPFDAQPFDEAIADCRARLSALNPQSRLLSKRASRSMQAVPAGTNDGPPDGTEKTPVGRPDGSPAGAPEPLPSGSQETETETGILKKEKNAVPPLRDGRPGDGFPNEAAVITTPEADLFRRGKELLGPSAGGLIKNRLATKGGSIPQARAALEVASEKDDPREYLGGVLAKAGQSSRDLGGVRSSRDM